MLEARIATLNARIAQLTKQLAVMTGALNAAQQDSATVVQQAQQSEAAALKAAGEALKCEIDPDTLVCKPQEKKQP